MVVPYGDPGPLHGWKNAFDAGEWGLGRMANSLTLGCDCLGEIDYFDAVRADEHGDPSDALPNVICMHEEDYGILWKHQDMHSGRTEVRRSRRLVISSIATVGNYEYGFYWYLYLDGTVQLEVKLTGIMSTQALGRDEPSPHAPHRSGAFRAGPSASVLRPPRHGGRRRPQRGLGDGGQLDAAGDANPWGNGMAVETTRLEPTRGTASHRPRTHRTWHIVNPDRATDLANRWLQARSRCDPDPAGPPRLEHRPTGRVRDREPLGHALRPRENGDPPATTPTSTPSRDGLPHWTAADRSIVDTDSSSGTLRGDPVPRPEDWPVMPVEYSGFLLIPVGFFDRNPVARRPGHDGRALSRRLTTASCCVYGA